MKIILSKNSKIQGLLLKDVLQLKNYERTLISFVCIFSMVAIFQVLSGGSAELLKILPVMLTLGFGMYSITSFNYDEAAKTDRYIGSLPVSTKEIVLSKYILTIGLTIIGALIGMSLTIILYAFLVQEEVVNSLVEILFTTLGGIFGLSIVEAIQIPCIYQFGAERARMQIFLVMVVLFVLLALLLGGIFYWFDKWSISIHTIKPILPFILIGGIVLIYYSSYQIAYKIYQAKEF